MSPARPRLRAFPLSGSVLIAVIGGLAFGTSSAAAAAPVCNDVSYTVESEQALALPINGPCTDSDGPSSLQGQLVTSPAHGTIGPGRTAAGSPLGQQLLGSGLFHVPRLRRRGALERRDRDDHRHPGPRQPRAGVHRLEP